MAEILQINIIAQILTGDKYILSAIYCGSEDKNKLIPLNYVNNNHFEIMYPINLTFSYIYNNFKKKIYLNHTKIILKL